MSARCTYCGVILAYPHEYDHEYDSRWRPIPGKVVCRNLHACADRIRAARTKPKP